jgi:4-carboxymuconolactone decarboxylase
MLPADIFPESRCRLPLVRRDDLDDAARAIFDKSASDPQSLVGLRGPGGIRLHNPELTAISQPVNRYLRFGAGLDPRLVEVTILATARELESTFEWCAHEPEARKLGVPDAVIDAILQRGPLDALPADDALMIRLVREAVGAHRVNPATYAQAHARLGTVLLLNYVSLIGNYMGTAVLLTTFDQQLPEGASPAF